MTIIETPRRYGPQESAVWPPAACPAWCRDAGLHRESDALEIRFHDEDGHFVELSSRHAGCDETENWLSVSGEQPAGCGAHVALSFGGSPKVALTLDEAIELSDRLVRVVQRIGGQRADDPEVPA